MHQRADSGKHPVPVRADPGRQKQVKGTRAGGQRCECGGAGAGGQRSECWGAGAGGQSHECEGAGATQRGHSSSPEPGDLPQP